MAHVYMSFINEKPMHSQYETMKSRQNMVERYIKGKDMVHLQVRQDSTAREELAIYSFHSFLQDNFIIVLLKTQFSIFPSLNHPKKIILLITLYSLNL